jgi:phage terminase small subunit
MTLPKAPAGLSRRSVRLWKAVLEEFELSPAELELLRSALVALDRADQAAEVITAEGVTTTDRYGGAKMHPAVDVEARNRALYGRFVAQLGVKATVESVRNRVGAKPGPRPRAARLRQGGG